ncbi:uncharacterized protein LOC107874142 [Capsicum annuum]|uniref:uncharacterized protein LOC107874142 n=1 Tax=Capsicum annuum TaxID=4072 RepID=UPI0007BF5B75|nr:uncharacterized protein LOC107874142 [Capsicum annuum]
MTPYNLNTDGSFLENPGKDGIGGAIRNEGGGWILGFAKHYLTAINNQIELLALIEGLKLAKDNNLFPLEINTNSRSRIRRQGGPRLIHFYKVQNGMTDAIEKLSALTVNLKEVPIFEVPPMCAPDTV